MRFRHMGLQLAGALLLASCWSDDRGDDDATARGAFTALGTLPGYAASDAGAVSSDGRAIAGTATSASGIRQAFRWTTSQRMVGLGFLPGGTFSAGKGISANGSVVVGDADGGDLSPVHAFRWTVERGVEALPALPGSTSCVAAGVSGEGDVVAGTCLVLGGEAYRFTDAAGLAALGRYGTGSNATSSAASVAADGGTIGGAGHPVLTGAIVWDAANAATIIGGLPGTTQASVTALSRDGRVAVGTAIDAARQPQAFRWSAAAGIVALERTSTFTGTFAAGVSSDARRIVGWATGTNGDIAILWDESGRMRIVSDLLSPEGRAASDGWRLLHARAISGDGRAIVGDGLDPGGVQEAWLVTLPD